MSTTNTLAAEKEERRNVNDCGSSSPFCVPDGKSPLYSSYCVLLG